MTGSTAVTCVVGKDDSLENSIARMQQALAAHGFNVVARQWGNPAPHIWWVHVVDADNPRCFTNGKGATRQAALASALGEFVERLACNYFFADFYWGEVIARGDFVHYPNEKWFAVGEGVLGRQCPAGLLDDELAHFYDPTGELPLSELHDINAGISARGICTLPFVRQSDAEVVYFPVNIINNLYVSNGMAAGNTVMEARTQALSEIVERWVKNTIIAEGIALPRIPAAVLARYPHLVEAVAQMRAQGYCVQLLDASLGGQFPVIAAVLLNPVDGGCLTAFGAHPHFAVALERTLTELLQGRELKQLEDFPAPTFDQDWVADAHNLETHFIDSSGVVSWCLLSADADYAFVDWQFSDDGVDTAADYAFLCGLFQRLGADIYIADYDDLGVYACRVLVPRYSEIYPVEELLDNNNNVGNRVREEILRLPEVTESAVYESLRQWLDDSTLDDAERLSQVLGLAIGSDNAWYGVRLGELRCWLTLALGDFEEALAASEWLSAFAGDSLSDTRRRFFACLNVQLQIALDDSLLAQDYASIHRQYFGEDIYTAVREHLLGRARCFGLSSSDLSLQAFAEHQCWLSRYRVWQSGKKVKKC